MIADGPGPGSLPPGAEARAGTEIPRIAGRTPPQAPFRVHPAEGGGAFPKLPSSAL